MSKPPKVLVTVQKGIAEVTAVAGEVDISIVDLDLDGLLLSEEEIDIKVSLERQTGTERDFKEELKQIRQKLEKHKEESDAY